MLGIIGSEAPGCVLDHGAVRGYGFEHGMLLRVRLVTF